MFPAIIGTLLLLSLPFVFVGWVARKERRR
jgi:hypothetical protein